MKILEVYDDLAWLRSEAKIPATEVWTISVSVRDARTGHQARADEAFAIELGEGNGQDVDKYLSELRKAGHDVHVPKPVRETVARRQRHPPGYCAALREWVVAENIRHRRDPSRLAFETPSGTNSYPKWLCDLYDNREQVKGD
jgi:hypothetical protein